VRGGPWTITSLGTHNSTHVDAPWHYNSVVAGEPAQTIDEVPLDWFYARGVCVDVMGIDAWSWDRTLHLEAREAVERDTPGVFWAAHQCDLPYYQIERLHNLAALPPTGFTVLSIEKTKGRTARPRRS
jgi:kynurenine formamidase